ncbi:hypothetical protein RP20_CCG026302 [Aedes albopictus]|nr:hypothetical protein RP20_CCG026302 [Aedes albopictus]
MSQASSSQPECTKRGKNWAAEEDEQLCRSWLHVSKDSVKGTDQQKGDFWKAIKAHAETFLPSFANRPCDGLRQRFGSISHQVSKTHSTVTLQRESDGEVVTGDKDAPPPQHQGITSTPSRPIGQKRAKAMQVQAADPWIVIQNEMKRKNDLLEKYTNAVQRSIDLKIILASSEGLDSISKQLLLNEKQKLLVSHHADMTEEIIEEIIEEETIPSSPNQLEARSFEYLNIE